MEQQDVERIARAVLKELGVKPATLIVAPVGGQPGLFTITVNNAAPMKVKCGRGSSAQWVRDQIFEQYLAQG